MVDTPPTITGTFAGQTTTDDTSIQPFEASGGHAGVTIGGSGTSSPTLDVAVTLDVPANGQFSATSTGAGWTVDVAAGIYRFSGDAAIATAALRALVFVPTNHQKLPGQTATTRLIISVSDGLLPTLSDGTTTVLATAVNNPATIGRLTVGNQAISETDTVAPFANVTFVDPDLSNEPVTLTVALSDKANGHFTAGSLGASWTFDAASGTYSFSSGTRAEAQAALRALVFSPTLHQVVPGDTVTTQFTISLTDGTLPAVSDGTTTVVATAVNNAGTISVPAPNHNQAINDSQTRVVFGGVTFSDSDNSAEPASVTVTISDAANGQFTSASTPAGWTVDVAAGTYTFSGTRSAVQAALQALVFAPTVHQVAGSHGQH